MARYKNDTSRRITRCTNYLIPMADEVEGEATSSVTAVQFPAGSTYRFIKQELRKVFIALGCNRQEAKRATKKIFPELFV